MQNGGRNKMDRLSGWDVAKYTAVAFVTLVILVVLFIQIAPYFGLQLWQPTQQQQQQQQQQTGTVPVNKPLLISLQDPLKGAAIASATVYIYTPDKVLRETLTTDSAGKVTTALPYQSDSTIYVKVVKSGYVTRWYTVTVPRMTQADAQSSTTNFVALQDVAIGTYTIKVTDQFGTTYTSGGSLNFTTLGVTSVSLQVSIYNTVDNTGYVSSNDFLNGVNLNAVFMVSTGGSAVVVSGAGTPVTRGTTSYWLQQVPDDGLTRQLVGQTYVKPGTTGVTFSVNKGSLAHGSTQAFTLTLYVYFDIAYFSTNGIGGPDATPVATFSLNFAA
jgi:biopolymer transport protein ExbD